MTFDERRPLMEDDLENEDNLKNEDDRKNEYNLRPEKGKYEDDIKK